MNIKDSDLILENDFASEPWAWILVDLNVSIGPM